MNCQYKIFIIVVVCLCFLLSCYNTDRTPHKASLESTIGSTLGKKLFLPNNLHVYSPFPDLVADSATIFNAEYKLFTHINASCGSCITEIKLWENLVTEFDKYKIPIILICESDDRFELLKYLCETGGIEKFSYPFFLDKKNEYIKRNQFMEKAQDLETVLIDKENNILLLGNPIRSKEMKELYLKEIQKRMQ